MNYTTTAFDGTVIATAAVLRHQIGYQVQSSFNFKVGFGLVLIPINTRLANWENTQGVITCKQQTEFAVSQVALVTWTLTFVIHMYNTRNRDLWSWSQKWRFIFLLFEAAAAEAQGLQGILNKISEIKVPVGCMV